MMVDKKYYGFYAASTTPINHKILCLVLNYSFRFIPKVIEKRI